MWLGRVWYMRVIVHDLVGHPGDAGVISRGPLEEIPGSPCSGSILWSVREGIVGAACRLPAAVSLLTLSKYANLALDHFS